MIERRFAAEFRSCAALSEVRLSCRDLFTRAQLTAIFLSLYDLAKRDEKLARLTNTREDMLIERQRKAAEHKQRTLAMYDNMARSAPAGGKKTMDIGILQTGQSMCLKEWLLLLLLGFLFIPSLPSQLPRHQRPVFGRVRVTLKTFCCSANRRQRTGRRRFWPPTRLPLALLQQVPLKRSTCRSSLRQMVSSSSNG